MTAPTQVATPTPENPKSTSEKKKSKVGLFIGLGGAAAVLVAGTVVGVNVVEGANHTNLPPNGDKDSSESASPSPSTAQETELSGEALTKKFEIPTGLSDQELGEAFVKDLDAWNNYGQTQDAVQQWLAAGDNNAFEAAYTAKYAEDIADGFLSNSSLNQTAAEKDSIDAFKVGLYGQNGAVLDLWLKTQDDGVRGDKPYSLSRTAGTVTAIDGMPSGVRQLEIPITFQEELKNLAETRYKELQDPIYPDLDGTSMTLWVMFDEENGHEAVIGVSADHQF